MENKITSLIENKKMTSLEKKVEDSQKHMHTHARNAISTMRVIENISVVIQKRMLEAVKISRDDPVHLMRLSDDSTKKTGHV